MLASLAATMLAGWLVHRFVLPGMLGDFRSLAVLGMYAVLFATLMTSLVLVWQFHQSSIAHARAARDLELARQIQHSFLPEAFPTSPRIEVHAVNVPSRGVSGDFYDAVPVGSALLLAIADVEGKSIPAALLTAMLQASLRTQTDSVASVAAIAGNINTLVCRRVGTLQQFATFFLARVEEDGWMTFANAGHNPPMLFRATGDRTLLEQGGMMFGVMEGAPYQEEGVQLQPGDRVVLYTDGITERTNPQGEEFGTERLTALVWSLSPDLPAREVTGRVLLALDQFSDGVEPADDQTLMVLRVRASHA
jgi:sigma-B regulation protein RsbU (phosphoserine phosphatase)